MRIVTERRGPMSSPRPRAPILDMDRPTCLHRIRTRSAEIRGDTLIEVAIAAALAVVVLGAIVSFVVVVQRTEVITANYAYAQSSARSQLDEMVSQIRAAWNVI